MQTPLPTGIALAGALAFATPTVAQQNPVFGTWITESGSARVKLDRCPDPALGPVCGTIVGLTDPVGPDGKPVAPESAVDWRNADPSQRTRKVLGTVMLWGFKGDGAGAFEGGRIYNGGNGKTYDANMALRADGRLAVRGYVGLPLLGESQLWTRAR